MPYQEEQKRQFRPQSMGDAFTPTVVTANIPGYPTQKSGLLGAIETVLSNTAQPGSARFAGPDETQQPGFISSVLGSIGDTLNRASGDPNEVRRGPLGSSVSVYPQRNAENTATGFTQGESISIDQGAEEKIPHEFGHVVQSRLNPIGTTARGYLKGTVEPAAQSENTQEVSANAQALGALIRAAERGDTDAQRQINAMDPRDVDAALQYSNQRAPGFLDALLAGGQGSFLPRSR